jgi:hypothetical protein
MTILQFQALPTAMAEGIQSGMDDANGQPPERHISDGQGNPCRHCLMDIPEGEPFLVFAHRPFPTSQPYAVVGPIFLHAETCERYDRAAGVPAIITDRDKLLIRGYGDDNRIVYGSGQVIASGDVAETAAKMFERPEIAYIHLRSSSYNCYTCRIDRA